MHSLTTWPKKTLSHVENTLALAAVPDGLFLQSHPTQAEPNYLVHKFLAWNPIVYNGINR